MDKEKITNVSDVIIEKRVLISNVIASLVVIFLGYISLHVTGLSVSSKVQATQLINLNDKFSLMIEGTKEQMDRHIDNSRIHSYKQRARYTNEE